MLSSKSAGLQTTHYLKFENSWKIPGLIKMVKSIVKWEIKN